LTTVKARYQVSRTRKALTFAYDPFGRRIKKVTSSATSIYAYDGDDPIEEANAGGAVVARRVAQALVLGFSGAPSSGFEGGHFPALLS
jgi:hypothetical protein